MIAAKATGKPVKWVSTRMEGNSAAMAAAVGPIVFVIVVGGGMGSLAGAFYASLLIGFIQTFAVSLDWGLFGYKVSQIAPVLPYVVMVLMLILRPRGLLGTRDG